MRRSHRRFVSYIDKSRAYYAAQGYEKLYEWASNDDAPFAPLSKPLSQCRVGVITTASLAAVGEREQYFAPSSPTPDSLVTDHLFWHKGATHTNDLGSYLPLDHLRTLVGEGVIDSVGPRLAGAPTLYSHRLTDRNAATIAEVFVEDEVDLALLIPL